MHVDPVIALGSLAVGFIVGLTGVGGGALMTPILVLFFGVSPLAAVSSDLVASVVMKPVGGAVHARRGTVDREIVGWLVVGSVPAAFVGVLVLRLLASGRDIQLGVQIALGVALLLAASAMALKVVLDLRRERLAGAAPPYSQQRELRPLPTIAVGVLGGLVVGMTSVGSGSLMIVLLLFLYPALKPAQLVGTVLVQAIPLVTAAAVGHLMFGDVQFGLTASLLVGGVPGVYLGARISAQASGRLIRCAIGLVLFATGLRLVQIDNRYVGLIVLATVVTAVPAWVLVQARGSRRTSRNIGTCADD